MVVEGGGVYSDIMKALSRLQGSTPLISCVICYIIEHLPTMCMVGVVVMTFQFGQA